jgi:hypothetical protein
MTQRRITDDLHALLGVLPPEIANTVVEANNSDALLEIVMDLGRLPIARFVAEELVLAQNEVTRLILSSRISASLTRITGPVSSAPCTAFQPFATAAGILSVSPAGWAGPFTAPSIFSRI